MESTSRRKGSAVAAVIVIVSILAILGGAAWYFMLRSTPEKAVATMMQAMKDGDREKLKAVLTDRSQEFAGMARGPMGMSDARDKADAYEIGAAEVSGEQAKVPVTYPIPEALQQGDMKGITIKYVVHHVDGQWKVDMPDTIKSMMGDLMPGGGGGMAPPEDAQP